MSDSMWVVSTVRKQRTRLHRMSSPNRHRFKQFILGGTTRLVRARAIEIQEATLQEHGEELERLWKAGLLEVHEGSPEGPLYDFATKSKGHKAKPKKVEEVKPVEEPKATTVPEAVEPEVVAEAELETLIAEAETESVEEPSDTSVESDVADEPKRRGRRKKV